MQRRKRHSRAAKHPTSECVKVGLLLFNQLIQRYFTELDSTMREIVDIVAAKTPGFGVMLRYPMGWVDQHNQPYSQPTGKRIRPLLLLLTTEAAGGDWHTALPAAAAVEILHNFSLIHDDIQDDSPTRHGRPTVWKVWGNPDAINAGDAMLCLAFHALESLSSNALHPQTVLAIWRVFNQMTLELTRGQYLDMHFEKVASVSVDDYISMISGKSAALVSACAQIGALIATQDETVAQSYADFGLNLGIAFQIHDDVLGIWGDPTVTGKSVATDILSRKKSLPVLFGLSHSPKLVEIYSRESFGDDDVAEAVGVLNSLNALQYTRDQEAFYTERANVALAQANPHGDAGNWLRRFVDALFSRVN